MMGADFIDAMNEALINAPIPTHGTEQPEGDLDAQRLAFLDTVRRLSAESAFVLTLRGLQTTPETAARWQEAMRRQSEGFGRSCYLETAKNYQRAGLAPLGPVQERVIGFALKSMPAGSMVRISGFSNPENNGVYRVVDVAETTMTLT